MSVLDINVSEPTFVRAAMKTAGTRRTDGGFGSMWRHGRAHVRWAEQSLRRQAATLTPDVVLEIQDIGATRQPFLILQDLSYELLLGRYRSGGVPHFRGLSARRIHQLRDRQVALYHEAAMLLPMSRWLAEDMVASGVPRERVTVVNPGVNIPPRREATLPARRRSVVHRLLFVGRDFDTKGGMQVVRAFHLLRAELGNRIELTIIGPGRWPLAGEVPEGVSFEGLQSRVRVAEALDTHDLLVVPSIMEGFGIIFAEALVRGLPCIGRNTCAMPEIIDQATGGRLVETEDPEDLAKLIVSTLADDSLYAACQASVPARIEHYSWERAARQVAGVVDGLV